MDSQRSTWKKRRAVKEAGAAKRRRHTDKGARAGAEFTEVCVHECPFVSTAPLTLVHAATLGALVMVMVVRWGRRGEREKGPDAVESARFEPGSGGGKSGGAEGERRTTPASQRARRRSNAAAPRVFIQSIHPSIKPATQTTMQGAATAWPDLCREPGAAMNLSGDGGGGRGVAAAAASGRAQCAAAAVCRKRSNLDDPVHVRLSRGRSGVRWGEDNVPVRRKAQRGWWGGGRRRACPALGLTCC